MMKRRSFLKAGAAASLSFAGFPAIIKAAGAAEPVTIVTPFGFIPDFIEIMNGVSGGHFAKQGIDAKIVGAHGSAQSVQQVVAGQAQYGRTSGIDLITAARKQNLPLVAIATLYQGSTFQFASLKTKPINSGAELKGKTVGIVSVGGATDTYLDLILTKSGLKKEDVKREVVGNSPGALELVKQGRIDGFICSINVCVLLERNGEPVTYWSMDKYAPMPSQIYFSAKNTLETKPDLAVRFLRGMKGSVDELMNAPLAPIFKRASKDFDIQGLKDIEAAVAIEKTSIDKLWLSEGKQNLLRNVPSLWKSGVDALSGIGIIPATDPTTLYTNRYVDAAMKT